MLNEDIFDSVAKFLSYDDMVNMSCTSKLFHEYASNHFNMTLGDNGVKVMYYHDERIDQWIGEENDTYTMRTKGGVLNGLSYKISQSKRMICKWYYVDGVQKFFVSGNTVGFVNLNYEGDSYQIKVSDAGTTTAIEIVKKINCERDVDILFDYKRVRRMFDNISDEIDIEMEKRLSNIKSGEC